MNDREIPAAAPPAGPSACPPPRPWRPSPLVAASVLLHAAAAAAVALAPRTWTRVLLALAADHILLSLAGTWPRGRLLGPNRRRLDTAESGRRRVALTFDDGPDPEVTPRVLDLLDQAGAGATFFAIGRHAEAHPEVVAEIVRRGHRVENHSYHHSNAFAFSFPGSLGRDIDRAQASLARTSGRWPVYFRAPAGMRNPFFEPVLARRGLRLVSWTRRGYDTIDRDPCRVCRRLTDGLVAGDILLLHDGSATLSSRHRPVVLEALPRLLDTLDARGLRSIPIPDPCPPPDHADKRRGERSRSCAGS